MNEGLLPNLAEAARRRAASARWARAFRRKARSPGPTSSTAPAPARTASSTSSTAIRAAVHAVLLRRGNVPGEGGWEVGDHRLPARFLAVQPQAARDRAAPARACRSGTTSTRPAFPPPSTICRRTIRPARRSTATIAASAAWARRTCWAPTAPTSSSPRTVRPNRVDEGGGKRSRLIFENETAQAADRRPGRTACSRSRGRSTSISWSIATGRRTPP